MHTIQTLDVRAFDCNIHFQNSCPEVGEVLDRYVFSLLPGRQDGPSSRELSICVERVDGRYRLSIDGVEVASLADPRELVLAVVRALEETVVCRLRTLKAVHAGAIVFGEEALLVPGSTHAGKSSMVAELLRRGAKLLSDEYALIDQAGFAHSYPRSLLLRNGRPVQTPVLPEELSSSFARRPVPVRWILALEYRPEATWDVREVPQSEALMILLTNTPHPMAESPEIVDFFIRAVSGARCFAGVRGEAGQAADRILQLVGRPA